MQQRRQRQQQGQRVFNDADVTLVQGMIPDHQQAIEMAKLAPTRAKSAKVKDLAGRIEAAQQPELGKMQGRLEDWGKSMASNMVMPAGMGTMSAADMKSIESLTGAEFDTMFLTMMVKHHQGAVAMAHTEIADGKSSDATTLARTIIKAQQSQITEMRALLKSGNT